MRLSEPIEKSGYFWLPGHSENRLPGILRISDAGEATLEVIGVFGGPLASLTADNLSLNRVVGIIESGDFVTLDQCFYKNTNINFGGLSKSIIYANLILIGAGYAEGEVVTFSRFFFSAEGLDEWLSISGLRVEHNWDDRSASIHFTPPKEVTFQISEGITLAFTFGWTIPGSPTVTEAKITQKAYISLTSTTMRPIEDFLALIFKINNFLCFAIDETVSLDSATGYSREKTKDTGNGKTREVPIKIYYESIPYSKVKPKVQWHSMLFCYGNVANEFEKILRNWLTNYETSEPAFNLYFSSKSGAHRYIDGRFLSLAQGIETLHRRNSRDTLIPENEFNELLAKILKVCPVDKQEWLAGKLNYANELSLRQRLNQMIGPFQHYFGTPDECRSFIARVVDTRNYLTHYDNRLSSRAASGEKLWELCMKLEGLFQLHFLRLIGLDQESINKLVEGNYAIRDKLNT